MLGVADRASDAVGDIDAVTASWTIGSEEDVPALHLAGVGLSHDLHARQVRPGVRWAGLPGLSPALARRASGAA